MNSSWIVLSWQWPCGKEECIEWSFGAGDCGPSSFLSWVREPVVVGKMLEMRWESIFWLQKGPRWGRGWVSMLGHWPVAVKIYPFGRRDFPSLTEREGGERVQLWSSFSDLHHACVDEWASSSLWLALIHKSHQKVTPTPTPAPPQSVRSCLEEHEKLTRMFK